VLVVVFVKTDVVSVVRVVDVDVVVGQSQSRLGSRVDVVRSGSSVDVRSVGHVGPEVTGHEVTGHEVTGHEVTGHEVTGHEVTGHEVTGHEVTGHGGQEASHGHQGIQTSL